MLSQPRLLLRKELIMWFAFFKFDLRYQLRQPLLWVISLLLGALAFGVSTSDAIQVGGAIGNINRNAPVVIVQFFGVFTLLSMFLVTIFIAGTVLRDTEIGIADMIFATPIRKQDYLLGRFLAGLITCVCIFILVGVGLLLGPLMPWIDSARLGPFSLYPYAWAMGVFVLPNLLFISALLLLLAVTTRSMMLVYIGVLAFFILWIVASAFSDDINNEWIASLIDPFGLNAFERMTRYFSVFESNNILPTVDSFLLANRLVWSTIALILFGASHILFTPQHIRAGRRFFKKAIPPTTIIASPLITGLPRIEVSNGRGIPWQQCWSLFCFDVTTVFKGLPFLVMLLFAVVNFVAVATQSNGMFGTAVYPVTRLMLLVLNGSFNFMLVIILTFYAGELIFKNRQLKMAEICDALPIPNWVPLFVKCLALIGIILSFMLIGVFSGVCFQWFKGGTNIEVLLYAKGVLLDSTFFVLVGMCAIALQVFTNNKFLGYLLIILLLISQIAMGALHFDHNLYMYAGLPAIPYSDMNGYGHFFTGWGWYALYWGFFAISLLIMAHSFWVRGLSTEGGTRLRLAVQRLKGRWGVALILTMTSFIATGIWIFYNTNVLNEYIAGDVEMDQKADYEKKYAQYKDRPLFKITRVRADVDIFPAERRVMIRGHYVLQNKTAKPLDTLYVQINPKTETTWNKLPPHEVTLQDIKVGFSIIKLKQPIAAGASLPLDFTVAIRHLGFTNTGMSNPVKTYGNQFNFNGTFFNNQDFFPHFGYNKAQELTDRNERRKRGLKEAERMPKLDDQAERINSILTADADWIDFETTVSTAPNQIALAPGYLQNSWEQSGRRYYHYKMDRPMLPFFAYLSANWEIKKAEWQGIPIEIYYDKRHGYNVDRMIAASQKSLDYYTEQFTPYQHKQLRILEFPAYQSFAQSFANTIPYSEAVGFIADLRNPEDIDYVYYITAHEIAHQWWGHQVIGANVQGATMLMESLAQYFALMVMEKEYGRTKMRRFLRHELDAYLRGRGGDPIEELPLYRVEGQQYIHYNKGSLIFYRLRDEIGEEALNRALKRFLQSKGGQTPPYTTSQELIEIIRSETPFEKQSLVTDLFEKMVIYDNRVQTATARQRLDGKWEVTMQLHLAKKEVDGKGVETSRLYDEPVEIAVFARSPGEKEKDERLLFIDKRQLRGAQATVTLIVDEKPFEVGVDPYNKLIDRLPTDNRKKVHIE